LDVPSTRHQAQRRPFRQTKTSIILQTDQQYLLQHRRNNLPRWPPATPTSHCDAGSPSSRLFYFTAASALVYTSSSETVSVRLQLGQKEGGIESSTSVFSGISKTLNKRTTSASSFLSGVGAAARSRLPCLEKHSSRNATRTLTP
jgi:hypothetical protein